MERTLCIIKPDAVRAGAIGSIIARIEEEQFSILGMKKIRMSLEMAQDFYAVHRERPFYGEVTEFMSSGPTVVIALGGEDAVAHWRRVIGATNPEEAEEGTIRAEHGSNVGENAVHGSDSPENGRLEVSKFFSEMELIALK
jgi:nucleoside-diphosphate kinase